MVRKGKIAEIFSRALLAGVVSHHPLVPEGFSRVQVQAELREEGERGRVGVGRRGIERRPAMPWNPRLHPTVRIGRTHQPQLGDGVVSSALEPRGQPGRDAQGGQVRSGTWRHAAA